MPTYARRTLGFAVLILTACAPARRTDQTAPDLAYEVPGLATLKLSRNQRTALELQSTTGRGSQKPASDFRPTGPNVTVHVARATRNWLERAAIYPESVDRFLAEDTNFFPYCTICAGVRLAFEHYRESLRTDQARSWFLGVLDDTLTPEQGKQLRARQSKIDTLAPILEEVYRRQPITAMPADERKAFIEAARRMDEYTTEFAKSGQDPRYAGKGCELCRAVTGALEGR